MPGVDCHWHCDISVSYLSGYAKYRNRRAHDDQNNNRLLPIFNQRPYRNLSCRDSACTGVGDDFDRNILCNILAIGFEQNRVWRPVAAAGRDDVEIVGQRVTFGTTAA
jgi:hypothetical protein